MNALAGLLSGGAAALAGAAMGLVVWVLYPGERRVVDLRGYRETKRKDGLERSTLIRLVWPLVGPLGWYARFIPGSAWREELRQRLIAAGEPLGLDVDEAVGLNLALVLCALGCAFGLEQVAHLGPLLYVLFLMVGAVMPSMFLSELTQERFKQINRGLPPVLDLIVMAMTAGGDFMGAVAQVVSKWSRKRDPLYDELSRFLNDLMLGKTRREALEAFAARAPTELVKTFVGAVIEAEQRGTPLVEVLAIQAEVARTRRFQRAEQIAGRAGVLVKLPLILILAACMLVMFGGVIVKALRGELW